MKTFQNRGEGFDVGEEDGGLLLLNDVANQPSKLKNRCHMMRDVVDDEILNFFRSKERTSFAGVKKRHNRIRGFTVDDEILLGDEDISNFRRVVFFVSWNRIGGEFELGRFVQKCGLTLLLFLT